MFARKQAAVQAAALKGIDISGGKVSLKIFLPPVKQTGC